MTQTLVAINRDLEILCEEIEGMLEIPDNLVERFVDTRLAHENKVGAYVAIIKRLQMEEAFLSERADQLNRRAKAIDRLTSAIKQHLVYAIETAPDLPWKSTEGDKVRAQDNPESLRVDVPTMTKSLRNIILPCCVDIPQEFVQHYQAKILDTDKIKAHLKAGNTLSWARLERYGKHVRIY